MSDYSRPDDPVEELVNDPHGFIQRTTAPFVENRVRHLEQELRDQRTVLNQERCHQALDADPLLRDCWRQLNSDTGFLRWLDGQHELSGATRLELLRQAYEQGAATRVAAIFHAYLNAQRTSPAPSRSTDHRPSVSARSRPRTEDVGPGRVWTRPEIAQFYDDVRHGRYAERDAARLRIEADIIAAARTGRVLNPPALGGK